MSPFLLVRVLAFIPSFFGSTGDAVNERQLLIALTKKVDKCYVVTLIGFKQLLTKRRTVLKLQRPKNLTIIPIPVPQVHPLTTFLAMVSISCFMSIIVASLNALGRMKTDLIYTRTSFFSIGFLTFKSSAKKTIVKIPSITEEELIVSIPMKLLIRKLASFLDRLALAKARKIAVHDILFYKKFVRLRSLKHNDEPLEIPPGVDLNLIRKARSLEGRWPMRNSTNIGFLGSLTWWQGADILIQAIALIKNNYPQIRLYFIGDGELRPEIEKMCVALNIPYTVTGFLPHEEALKYLKIIDVMVMPRRKTMTTESVIPLKLIESWAMRVPVIVTAHEVLKHKYKDGEDVLYVEPFPKDVANKISLLLSNKSLREKLSSRGVLLAREFSYDAIANTILKSLR